MAGVPAQPATDPAGGYVPAPVAFVSPDEEGDTGRPGFSSSDTRDDLPRPTTAWKDPARDHQNSSSRRRPVVFEEDDDLDVPDFLK